MPRGAPGWGPTNHDGMPSASERGPVPSVPGSRLIGSADLQ